MNEPGAPKADAVEETIAAALCGFATDRTSHLGVCGYTVRRGSGKGSSGLVVLKNDRLE